MFFNTAFRLPGHFCQKLVEHSFQRQWRYVVAISKLPKYTHGDPDRESLMTVRRCVQTLRYLMHALEPLAIDRNLESSDVFRVLAAVWSSDWHETECKGASFKSPAFPIFLDGPLQA